MDYRTALILIGAAFVLLFVVNVCLTYQQWKMIRKVKTPKAARRNKRPPVQVARCNCSFCKSRDTSVNSQLSPGAGGRH